MDVGISPIRTEQDYRVAMKRLAAIFDAKHETPEGDEMEILSVRPTNRTHVLTTFFKVA